MILFGEWRSQGCLQEEGEREMASGIASWGKGTSIFRPLKNQPSPGFRTRLQMLKLWLKRGETGVDTGYGVCLVPNALLLRKVCWSDFSV